MNNIIVPFSNKENYSFFSQNKIDGFSIGIEGFSENFNYLIDTRSLNKVINLLNENNQKAYIMLNKIYLNKDLESLKKLLKKISTLNVEAVIFSDMSVFNIVKEKHLNINLIWHSKMITNSKSINFLEKRGLYGYITTPQITLEEQIKIKKETKSKGIIKLFGYTNMATSSRTLLTNYFKFTKMHMDPHKKYYMYEKISGEYYPIIESGTTNFFSSKVLNGLLEFKKILNENIDLDVYLDDYMIDPSRFYNVIEAFSALKNYPSDEEFTKKLKEVIDINLYNETDNGFLNKKTIFKVK